ncbi:MAG: glucosaminidase domain-containing protein [Tannerellaceae bacterium]|jgi:LysM repeat protein|nr:glucosaminidase domain-containing protein [Tannerellaceae bacterium]
MRLICKTISLIFMMIITDCLYAESQNTSSTYQKYINTYSGLAVKKQKEFGIPASITLAQGLLESGAGQSVLAKNANNHFGIKCHDWKGAAIYHSDNKEKECFRKYAHAEESYNDHSRFLKERPYYAELFKLNIKDYKGWAKGLQKCGYATDKAYANKLIKLIETYELYRFDSSAGNKKAPVKKPASSSKKKEPSKTVIAARLRLIQTMYGIPYVYAENNDTFNKIATETNTKAENLIRFNEAPGDYPLQRGDVVYLDRKKKKAGKPYYDHVVKRGESMHSISQKYGIQIKSLYKLNRKKENYVPIEGDVLKLR